MPHVGRPDSWAPVCFRVVPKPVEGDDVSDTNTSSGRKITLMEAVSIGIGGMVGGGIFAVLGEAATKAGGATPIAFLVGGIIAALTAASYARLSVKHPGRGGTVTIIDRVFGVSALTGGLNIVLWAGYIATTALYASAFANYTSALFTGNAPGPVMFRVLVVAAIAIPWVINLRNAASVAKTEGIIVGIKLSILVIVIIAGVGGISGQRLEPANWPSSTAIIGAAMLVFVAYEGFELIANSARDVANPKKTLPRAYALSVGIVILLYIAIAFVVVGSMAPDAIEKASDFALAEAASDSLGQLGFTMVAISAVLATFSAINATLYGTARLSWSIAAEGELPPVIERRTWNQPIGLHITAAISLLVAALMGLTAISAMSSAIFLAVFMMVNAAGVKEPGPLFSRCLSALGVVGCAVSLTVLLVQTFNDDKVAVVALVVLLLAAVILERFWLSRHRPTKRPNV